MLINVFKRKIDYSREFDKLCKNKLIINKMKESLKLKIEKSKFIRSQFDFDLPDYIIAEIIENEYSKDYTNLYSLIGLAIHNNKLSNKNAQIIMDKFKI